jgi:hypothetical protein
MEGCLRSLCVYVYVTALRRVDHPLNGSYRLCIGFIIPNGKRQRNLIRRDRKRRGRKLRVENCVIKSHALGNRHRTIFVYLFKFDLETLSSVRSWKTEIPKPVTLAWSNKCQAKDFFPAGQNASISRILSGWSDVNAMLLSYFLLRHIMCKLLVTTHHINSTDGTAFSCWQAF